MIIATFIETIRFRMVPEKLNHNNIQFRSFNDGISGRAASREDIGGAILVL